MVIPRVEIAVKEAMDKAATSTMKTVAGEQFKSHFTQILAPSFERSCQSMFQQLADTFDQGLQEYQRLVPSATPAQSAQSSDTIAALTSEVKRLQAEIAALRQEKVKSEQSCAPVSCDFAYLGLN